MSPLSLQRNLPIHVPLLTIVLDGVGLSPLVEGNAVLNAQMPNLKKCLDTQDHIAILAHGKAVGLASQEDMGNSEVGHNALGAGRIFDQGSSLVQNAIQSQALFQGDTWQWLLSDLTQKRAKPTSQEQHSHQTNTTDITDTTDIQTIRKMHFIGLLSDGNVHSHINHLFALIDHCAKAMIAVVRIHILLDGRDVADQSALDYVAQLEQKLQDYQQQGFDYQIASGGGRMKLTMDRYEADWGMVKAGWQCHVEGKAPYFNSAQAAILAARQEQPQLSDQYLPAFCIQDQNGAYLGKLEEGDSVCLFNFRGDRAIELSRAMEEENFNPFPRVLPKIKFAGMMQYDGDLKIPTRFLVNPPSINRTLSEYLVHHGISQFACSETQKFGHVTYFWNGNKSGKFNEVLEDYIEIKSDQGGFELRPWMKCVEITDATIQAIESGKYQYLRINFANGDMVGHTGNYEATRVGLEAVDLCLGRLLSCIQKAGGIAMITADHGNAEEMLERDKKSQQLLLDSQGKPKAKTSHTINPVPFIIYDPAKKLGTKLNAKLAKNGNPGLANVAATILNILGFTAPSDYEPSLLDYQN